MYTPSCSSGLSDRSLQDTLAAAPPQELTFPGWKRVTDLSVILVTLPLVAVVATVVYSWIKVVSPGPVLFRQVRVGRGGKLFTLYKFRSMHPGADSILHEAHVKRLVRSRQPLVKLDLHGDPRLIRGGFLLRALGVDELPQVINVLRGEMSLVGPRPCLPNELELYHPHHLHRFIVPPGLTGLWQVNRTQGTTFGDMVKMDDDYIERLAPWSDCQILFKTPISLLLQTKTHVGFRRRGRADARIFAIGPHESTDC